MKPGERFHEDERFCMNVNDEANERFTLAQAAKVLDISVPTARRLVFSEKLRGFKVMRGEKERWEVLKSEVFNLKHSGFVGNNLNGSEPVTAPFSNSEKASQKASESVPVQAHLAALEIVNRLHHQLEEERRHREQAERSKMAMEWQLQQYRTALSEQAESLAEAQALKKVAEARLEASAAIEPEPIVPLEHLKLGLSKHKTWGQRVKGWFGMRQAEG